jgi:hypothetical protein
MVRTLFASAGEPLARGIKVAVALGLGIRAVLVLDRSYRQVAAWMTAVFSMIAVTRLAQALRVHVVPAWALILLNLALAIALLAAIVRFQRRRRGADAVDEGLPRAG